MRTQDKRQPAFADTDLMPFGRHAGTPLQDVPAKYLLCLFRDLEKDGYRRKDGSGLTGSTTHITDRLKLAHYIWNSQEAICEEAGELL